SDLERGRPARGHRRCPCRVRRAHAALGARERAAGRSIHGAVPRALGRRPPRRIGVRVPRARRPVSGRLRAVFFDAGNTLIHMDYDAIASALAAAGVTTDARRVQRAEWRARVRLDASFQPGASTEHPSTAERYLAYLLDELHVRDAATVAALIDWRRGYNLPEGLWTVRELEAENALRLAHEAGLRTAVISNSNGTIAA